MRATAAGLLVSLIATLPAWAPWLDPRLNLLDLNDARNHMHRQYILAWMLEHGVWHPRWAPDLFMGYGYPVLSFYSPGSYYLGALFDRLLGLDTWDAFRAVGLLAALLGTSGAYALGVSVWGRAVAGVITAVALLYAPYAFQLNLFKKGDVPEALGLALLPWLLLALRRLWLAPNPLRAWGWLALAAGAGAGELLAHNISAVLAAVVALVWIGALALGRPAWPALGAVALAGATAAGSTAFFWIPALGETSAVQLERLHEGQLHFENWLVDPSSAVEAQRGPGNRQTQSGLIDTHLLYPHQFLPPPRVSLAQAVQGVIALVAVAWMAWQAARRRALTEPLAVAATLLVLAGACWFLTFSVSLPLWQHVPGLALLQLPSRLLGPLALALAIASAGGVAAIATALESRLRPWGRIAGWGVSAALMVGYAVNGAGDRPLPFTDAPRPEMGRHTLLANESEDRLGMGSTDTREFTPRDVQIAVFNENQAPDRGLWQRLYTEAEWVGGSLYPLEGDLRLLGWRAKPLALSVRLVNDAAQPGRLAIHQLRFPGWRAWIDGRPAEVGAAPYVAGQQASLGFLTVAVPPGEHTLTLSFGPTPLRLAGMGLTLATVMAATAVVAGVSWRRAPHQRHAALSCALAVAVSTGATYLTWRGVRPAFHRFVALPVAAIEPGGGVWRAAHLGAHEAGLVVNVSEAVRAGQARIASPSGSAIGPDRFVDVRQLTVVNQADPLLDIAGVSRRAWLLLHPTSSVEVDVALPAGREVWFHTTIALDPAVWDAPTGDGVRFVAEVLPASGGIAAAGARTETAVVSVERTLNPRARIEDRRWVPLALDLSPWAGQSIRLRLRTDPLEDATFDWGGWGNPVVVVRESARAAPPVMP
ncbi:MAG: hypothetical protein AVDCRST_MAG77-3099 [uncultured Chloroflexi bacterium]|uniref:Membrane protein 6-pyruvoyl-tetrahydropterin synthase-related domain-containing protein n=1 Tax=uncultured Chloroflexota bacterium TaxID=166587 RepID=A0A6J4J7R9_9CHLR|nr:MAG: hypothetical protein AVDCRST_MAG77-3099 [uncultured Chloroflexota bacterium]